MLAISLLKKKEFEWKVLIQAVHQDSPTANIICCWHVRKNAKYAHQAHMDGKNEAESNV